MPLGGVIRRLYVIQHGEARSRCGAPPDALNTVAGEVTGVMPDWSTPWPALETICWGRLA